VGNVGHIQFSDYPGRHEPGTGELDIYQLFTLITALPYRVGQDASIARAVLLQIVSAGEPSRRTENLPQLVLTPTGALRNAPESPSVPRLGRPTRDAHRSACPLGNATQVGYHPP
jgi:hypothetical protein